jgi:hypothetical protein
MIPLGPRGYAEAGSSQISRAIRRVVAAGPGRRSSSDPRDHARKVGFFFRNCRLVCRGARVASLF